MQRSKLQREPSGNSGGEEFSGQNEKCYSKHPHLDMSKEDSISDVGDRNFEIIW